MRLGIICPANIAIRRFLPALKDIPDIKFAGMAVPTVSERFAPETAPKIIERTRNEELERAQRCIDQYGGRMFDGYADIAASPDIDALYIPLPPALHEYWAEYAMQHGKHVLVEKPATLNVQDTEKLIGIARSKELALHENYMFVFHDQLAAIRNIVDEGEIGEVRLYRISFGFPKRAAGDFRYNRALGGGALMDAGGYVLKYARRILGSSCTVRYAQLNYTPDVQVDMYGSGALTNEQGITVQVAFGMDNDYKCELEIWGSKGTLYTNRVLTAPAGFVPEVEIRRNGVVETRPLPADNSFKKSISFFRHCVEDERLREESYRLMRDQAVLVDEFRAKAQGR